MICILGYTNEFLKIDFFLNNIKKNNMSNKSKENNNDNIQIETLQKYIKVGKIYTMTEWGRLWNELWKHCLKRHSHILDHINKYYDGFTFSFSWDSIVIYRKNCSYMDTLHSFTELKTEHHQIIKNSLDYLKPCQYVPDSITIEKWEQSSETERLKLFENNKDEYIPIYNKTTREIKLKRGYHPPPDKNWINVKGIDKEKLLYNIWNHACKMKYRWDDEIAKLHWNRYLEQGDCFRDIKEYGYANFIYGVSIETNIFETIDENTVYKDWINPNIFDIMYGKGSLEKIINAM